MLFTFLPGRQLQKHQMVIVRVGFGEGCASCYDTRHAQLAISSRDILTFGILLEAGFFFALKKKQTPKPKQTKNRATDLRRCSYFWSILQILGRT